MVLVNVVGLMLSDRTLASFQALFGEVMKNVFCGDFARLFVCPIDCHLLDLVPGAFCSYILSQTKAGLLTFLSTVSVMNE
jgi:hypothetical protein